MMEVELKSKELTDIIVIVKITMTVSEMKTLRGQLRAASPSKEIAELLDTAITKFDAVFSASAT